MNTIRWHSQALNGLAAMIVVCACGVEGANAVVTINELRVDQPGPWGENDPDEYVELRGNPGESLNGLTYVVIGDGATEQYSGVVEALIPLSGYSIGPSGLFLIAEPTFTLGTADLVVAAGALNFEDDDNVSHYLMQDFTAVLGQDLDLDDNGTLDGPPWPFYGAKDQIALIKSPNPPVGTEYSYGVKKLGPDGAAVPCQAHRGGDCLEWQIGQADLGGATDTPGAENVFCPPQPSVQFFGLPHTPIGAMWLVMWSSGEVGLMSFGPISAASIELDQAKTGLTPRWELRPYLGPIGQLGLGSVYEFAIRAEDDVLATLSISEINDGDASIGLSQQLCETCTLTVETLLEGAVVSSGTFAPPYPVDLVHGAIGQLQYNKSAIQFASAAELIAGELGTIINANASLFTITGQPAVIANAIRLRLNGVPPTMPVHDNVLLSYNVIAPDLGLSSEAFFVNGLRQAPAYMHGANVMLGADSDRDGDPDLVISNGYMPSEFGMDIFPPDLNIDGLGDVTKSLSATVSIGDSGTLPPGSLFKTTLHGVGSANTNMIDGSIEMAATSGQPNAIRAGFPNINATLHTTEIFNNGKLVSSQVGQSGLLIANVAGSAAIRDAHAQLVTTQAGPGVPRMSFEFDAPEDGIEFTLPDQSVVMGDEVHVTADNPSAFFESIRLVRLWGTLDTFTIIDNDFAVAAECPADIAPVSGNGTVDVDDLLAVINSWGDQGANPADLSGNGVVDVDDLLAVINAWGACE